MEFWYLYNSGIALKTQQHLLIFDYYETSPKGGHLAQGVVHPEDLQGEDVIVLVSHRHEDHYNPCIFDWRQSGQSIRYLLSSDIKTQEEALFLEPGQQLQLPDLKVETLHSTDEGVAFLLEIDGKVIYHAGDLNWWHWNGESEDYNQKMGEDYRRQVDLLKGREIDLAFVPMDPRLEEHYLLGMDCFMKTIQPKVAVPLHFREQLEVFDWLQKDERADDYRSRILYPLSRGDHQVL